MNLTVSLVLFLCVSGCLCADKLCLLGDFDSQAQYLLEHEFLNAGQLLNLFTVYDDIRHTLEQKWTGVKIIPFGSLVTGIACKTSDVDMIIRVQNYTKSSENYLFTRTVRLIRRQPELYSLVTEKFGGRGIPLINLRHNPTHAICDISFRSETSVENSQLLRYYFKLDQRNLHLASLIKFWSKVHRNVKNGIFKSYALYMLIVFYLEVKGLVPTADLLLENRSFSDWDLSFTEIPFKSSNHESLYQLMGGFFKFYDDFNFKDTIVSSFIGKVIPRSVFHNNSNIPEELVEYQRYLNWIRNSKPILLDTAMCVLDIFEQSNNIAEPVTSEQVGNFAYHVKLAVRAFDELPSDRFLSAILNRNDRDIILENEAEVDEIKKLEECTSVTLQN